MAEEATMQRLKVLAGILLLALIVPLVSLDALGKPKKPPPEDPPPQGEPEIACRYEVMRGRNLKAAYLSTYDLEGNRTDVAQVGVWGSTWSPDGLHIAWGVGIGVRRIDVDGTDLTVLYEDNFALDAAWSPDGETIAFAGDDVDDTLSILYLIPAEGGTPQALYTRPYEVWIASPTWNADGTHIAFLESEDGSDPWYVRVIEVSTGSITPVATLTMGYKDGNTGHIEWARTQDLLLYSTWWGTVYTLDPATGQSTEVTTGIWPSWSPDDSEIVFERSRTLVRRVLATGVETEIGPGRRPSWKR
jgi:hypothetical protein